MNQKIISSEASIDVYKQIIDIQSQNHSDFINVLLCIFLLFAGLTWIWNMYGSKKYIDRKIEKKIQNERDIMFHQLQYELKKSVESEIIIYESRLKDIEANAARAIAIAAESDKMHGFAIKWWAKALNNWIYLDNHKRIRSTIECIKNVIDLVPESEKCSIVDKDGILEIIEKIPDLLMEEKKYLRNKIQNNFVEDEIL